MKQRKICVVTATRAEYGLLKNLLSAIQADPDLLLQLVVTGTHLSPEFGYTIQHIINDRYPIHKKIEMLVSSDSPVGVSKSMGLAQISFAEAFDDIKPDIVVVLGDRFELIPIVTAANIASIPVAHLMGGEITVGVKDDIFRHAVTKLSHLHFTALEEYSQRVIQMGENPGRVFCVGALGLDNMAQTPLLAKQAFEQSIGTTLKEKNLLITYHPETNENIEFATQSFQYLLNALMNIENSLLIFTKANADVGGRTINKMIDDFANQHPDKAVAFESLGRHRYLSALQFVDGVVGNSSSGIVEAPAFKTGTVNIGDRQKGRVRAHSVIDTPATANGIQNALDKLFSPAFKAGLAKTVNPYGNGNTCEKIVDVLKKTDMDSLKNKIFYDIKQ